MQSSGSSAQFPRWAFIFSFPTHVLKCPRISHGWTHLRFVQKFQIHLRFVQPPAPLPLLNPQFSPRPWQSHTTTQRGTLSVLLVVGSEKGTKEERQQSTSPVSLSGRAAIAAPALPFKHQAPERDISSSKSRDYTRDLKQKLSFLLHIPHNNLIYPRQLLP